MRINTINSTMNHVKSVVKELQSSNDLPFVNVLPEESINEKINELDYRDRIFSPDLTIFAFLAQVTGADQSCQMAVAQVIAHLTRCKKEVPSANTAAYCKARARLPEDVLSRLAKESAETLEKQAKSTWLWRGRHIKIPDGTSVSMPDTRANQSVYPQSCTQKKELVFQLLEWLVFSHLPQVSYWIWRWLHGLGRERANMRYCAN